VKRLAFAVLFWTSSALALLPDANISELPAEARATLSRIKSGGPHPYPQDGRTFYNREKRLPLRERGYYREYTVKTPGSKDRGPRRIVVGANGEYYYTADHYRSFRRIIE
jgi:ribonuclease T1